MFLMIQSWRKYGYESGIIEFHDRPTNPCLEAALGFASAVFLTCFCSSPLHAAETDSPMEDIVVTAEKRTESLENVPMSITALTSATLESAGVRDFTDYAAKILNLTFSTGNNYGAVNSRGIAIRGIQGADTTGFYIDDLPVPLSLDPAWRIL